MRPTRRAQPYKKGQQAPGAVLSAMRKGSPSYLPNPADMTRMAQRRARRARARAKTLARAIPRP